MGRPLPTQAAGIRLVAGGLWLAERDAVHSHAGPLAEEPLKTAPCGAVFVALVLATSCALDVGDSPTDPGDEDGGEPDLGNSEASAVDPCAPDDQVGTAASEYLRGDLTGLTVDRISGGAGLDRIDGFFENDCLAGSDGEDVLFAGKGVDRVYGGRDRDWIYGGAEKDYLYGEDGDDVIYGGIGNDLINGGPGYDICYGQDGDDSFVNCEQVVSDAAVFDRNDPNPGARRVACEDSAVPLPGATGNADMLFGSASNEAVSAGEGADTVRGYDGSDCIGGGKGPDWIHGGAGNDLLMGESGSDTLYGGDGDDVIYGAGGGGEPADIDNIDLLDGGDGDDFLNGGPGTDEIYGGNGFDVCRGGPNTGGSADDKFRGCEVIIQD